MKRSCYVPILLLLAVGLVLVSAPLWEKDPRCSLTSITLNVEDLPAGWESPWIIVPPALDKLGAQEARARFMENGSSTAKHSIFRYSSRLWAIFHFWFERATFFPLVGGKWDDLEGFYRRRVTADQCRVKCRESDTNYLGTRCTAVLRYGPYISDFTSNIREGAMSVDDFQQMLLKIDDMFRSCMESHTAD